MKLDELRSHLSDSTRLEWKPLEELRAADGISCIDGRHEGCTVGAPGGNAGELVRLLAVLEWYAGMTFDERAVEAVMRAHVERLGSFYLHTDVAAAERIAGAIGSELDAQALLRAPPGSSRERISSLLVEPANVGCGHLRLLLEQPEAHRVRRALTEAVIRSFFRLLWDGEAGVRFAVLGGHHAEEALLVFHTTDPVREGSRVPTWCAKTLSPPVFVTHVPVLRWHRQRALTVVREAVPVERLRRLATLDVLLEIERLGERHLQLAMTHLAPHLPRYRVCFRDDGSVFAA